MDRDTAAWALRKLAEADQKRGETYEQAYARILKSDRGRYLYGEMSKSLSQREAGSTVAQDAVELFGSNVTPAERQFATAVYEEYHANGRKRGEHLQETFARLWRDPAHAELRNRAKAERAELS
jgi:hypothetical protein